MFSATFEYFSLMRIVKELKSTIYCVREREEPAPSPLTRGNSHDGKYRHSVQLLIAKGRKIKIKKETGRGAKRGGGKKRRKKKGRKRKGERKIGQTGEERKIAEKKVEEIEGETRVGKVTKGKGGI